MYHVHIAQGKVRRQITPIDRLKIFFLCLRFSLQTWAAAALTWAEGEQAWALPEPAWALTELA